MHWPGKQPETARGLRRLPSTRVSSGGCGDGPGRRLGTAVVVRAGRGPDGPTASSLAHRSVVVPGRRRRGSGRRVRVSRSTTSTTYAKFEVAGPSALAGLQRLVTSELDVRARPDRLHDPCRRAAAGSSWTRPITRLDDDRFLVLAPTVAQRRTEGLLRNGLPADAVVTDVTSGWSTLHLAGPDARELLSRLDRRRRLRRGRGRSSRPRDRCRARAGARATRVLHRRARLGAPGADRVRRGPLRAGRPSGDGPRAPPRGRVRVRGGSARAGLPVVGPRHGSARRPVRRRTRVRRIAPQGGGLRRPGCARAASDGPTMPSTTSARIAPRPVRRALARRVACCAEQNG